MPQGLPDFGDATATAELPDFEEATDLLPDFSPGPLARQARSVLEAPIRFERGLGVKIGDVASGAARAADLVREGDLLSGPPTPSQTIGQRRRAYVQAMSDPRYHESLTAAGSDPAKLQRAESLYGPEARLEIMRTPETERARIAAEESIARQARLETDSPLHEWGTAQANFARQVFHGTPDVDNTFISQLSEAAGGMLPDIMLSAVPVAGPALAAASYGLQAGEQQAAEAVAAGKPEAADLAFLSAAGLGWGSERLIGFAPRFWQSVRSARRAGLNPEQFGNAWQRWTAANPVKARILEGSAREGIQESSEQAGQNRIASDLAGYDPNRPWTKDVVRSGVLGATLGGIAGGVAGRISPPPEGSGVGSVRTEPPPLPAPLVNEFASITEETKNVPAMAATPSPEQSPVAAPIPIPEPPKSIAAQFADLTLGRRSIMLVTPGAEMPEQIPYPLETHQVPGREGLGTFIFNPRVRGARQINSAAANDTIGDLLGYGIPGKPAPAATVGAVTVRDEQGTEKRAVVTDAAHLPAVTEAAQASAAPGDTVQLESPEAVIQQRTAPSSPPPEGSGVGALPVTEDHLDQARQILREQAAGERAPDLIDELEGNVTQGPVQFAGPDYEQQIAGARERIALARFQTPYAKLRKPQRATVDKLVRASPTEGQSADQALRALVDENPKFADWTEDDLLNALLNASEARAAGGAAVNESAVRALAQEIAQAEAQPSTLNQQPSTVPFSLAPAEQARVTGIQQQAAREQPGLPVRVVHDANWLHPSGSLIEGTVEPDGTIVLNAAAPVLSTQAGVSAKLRHEATHVKLISPDGQTQLRRLAGKLTAAQTAELRALGYTEAHGFDADALANEFIARQAENNTAWWQRYVAHVRAWLAGNKSLRDITNEETAQAILRALESGKQKAESRNEKPFVASNAIITPPRTFSLTAYHGTPHEIDKFSTSKIGTGEGAQVYGWGLYFAENKAVSTDYATNIGKQHFAERQMIERQNKSIREALKTGKSVFSDGREYELNKVQQRDYKAQLDANLDRLKQLSKTEAGNEYTVDLDVKPEELLDWDKLIEQQPPELQRKLEHAYPGIVSRSTGPHHGIQQAFPYGITKPIAEVLNSVGIKGIRYLDQGSRFSVPPSDVKLLKQSGGWMVSYPDPNTGRATERFFRDDESAARNFIKTLASGVKTYNYVIFDEASIKITGKNGQEFTPSTLTRRIKGQNYSLAGPQTDTRRLTRQLDAAEWLGPAERAALTNRVYNVANDKAAKAAATDLLTALTAKDPVAGLSQAADLVLDRSVPINGAVRGFLVKAVAERYAAIGPQQFADFLNNAISHTTDAGQFISSLRAFAAATPDGAVMTAMRILEGAGEKVMASYHALLTAARTALDSAHAAAQADTLHSPDVQTAAAAAVDAAVTQDPEVQQAVRDEARTALANDEALRRQAAAALPPGADLSDVLQVVLDHFRFNLTPDTPHLTLSAKLIAAGVKPAYAEGFARSLEAAWKARVDKLNAELPRHLRNLRLSKEIIALAESIVRGLIPKAQSADARLRAKFAPQQTQPLGLSLAAQPPSNPVSDLADVGAAMLGRESLDFAQWSAHMTERYGQGVQPHLAAAYPLAQQRLAAEAGKRRAGLQGRTPGAAAKPPELSDTALTRLLRQKLGEWNQTLGQAVNRPQMGRQLGDAIVADSKLTGPAAEALRQKLNTRFETIAAQRKQKALDRLMAGQDQGDKKVKSLNAALRKLVDLHNAGALDDARFAEAVKAALGLKSLTPEETARLLQLAQELQSIPENQEQRREAAAHKLASALAKLRPGHWWDLPMGLWYSHILSGPATHILNIASSAQSLAGTLAAVTVRNPARLQQLIPQLARGTRQALPEMVHALAEGSITGPRLGQKWNDPGVWNRFDSNWLLPWKLVGRALAAADLLFFYPAFQAQQGLMARAIARQEGLSGQALNRRTVELLHNTPAARSAAAAQATQEGYNGLAHRRRVEEIIQQQRDAKANYTETGRDFALHTTFNNEPYGVLGAVAKAVNTVAAQFPAARFVMPFTNIIANVTNESLNYTPIGSLRALSTQLFGTRLYGKELDRTAWADNEALAQLHAKAALGTLMLSALLLKAAQEWDKDDPEFWIHGQGPSDANKRKTWQAAGGLINSLKVGGRYYSFQNTPLAIPLAAIGNFLDAHKYGKLGDASNLDRAALAMSLTGKSILQQSFLDSLARLFGAIEQPGAERNLARNMADWSGRTFSSFAVPNLLRQADQIYDPAKFDDYTVQGELLKNIPFVRSHDRPTLNGLGEPVTRPLTERWTKPQSPDPLWRELARLNVGVYPVRLEWRKEPLSEEQVYDVARLSGPKIRADLERLMAGNSWPRWTDETRRLAFGKVIEARHTEAKATVSPAVSAR